MVNPESMENPTKIRATPVTEVGIMRKRGERKTQTKNRMLVTTAVRPVRPPASTPMVDSMNVEIVVQPVAEPTTVPTASTRNGFFNVGKFPSSSSIFVCAPTAIKAPKVAKKSLVNRMKIQTRAPGMSARRDFKIIAQEEVPELAHIRQREKPTPAAWKRPWEC